MGESCYIDPNRNHEYETIAIFLVVVFRY